MNDFRTAARNGGRFCFYRAKMAVVRATFFAVRFASNQGGGPATE
jgi:hypothetical protein